MQAVRIARIQAGVADDAWRVGPARRGLLRAAQYAQLREAADHVVSPRARSGMAARVRYGCVDSRSRACIRGGTFLILARTTCSRGLDRKPIRKTFLEDFEV